MSDTGTRLDQLRALRDQITHQLHHVHDLGLPPRDLLELADRVDTAIRDAGGTPPPRFTGTTHRPTAPAQDRTSAILTDLGVTARDVKEWAVQHGLLDRVRRGRVAHHIAEAYAHQRKAGTP